MKTNMCLSSTIIPSIKLFHQPKYFLIFVSQPQTCATLNTQFITINIVCQTQTPKSTLLHNCTIDMYMLCNLYTSGSRAVAATQRTSGKMLRAGPLGHPGPRDPQNSNITSIHYLPLPQPKIYISQHSCDKITTNKSMKNGAFFLLWTTVESEGFRGTRSEI